MPGMRIVITGEGGAFKDEFRHHSAIISEADVGLETLDQGMTSGAPSVALFVEIPEQAVVVVAQTSVKLFQMAAAAMYGKYGDLTEGAFTATFEPGKGKATFSMTEAKTCWCCDTVVPKTKHCMECGAALGS